MKLREPWHDITIFERGAPGATPGWGVVFWGDLLGKLYSADPQSAREIEQASFSWDKQVVDVQGEQVLSAASRGYGIKRLCLLEILARRVLSSGVHIEFDHEVMTPSQLPQVDLIVACDGVNSRIRHETKGIHTDVRLGSNKYIWLGTDKVFESFTFPFVRTDSGWIWAHAYGSTLNRAHLSLNAQLKHGLAWVSARCQPKTAFPSSRRSSNVSWTAIS